ADISAGPAGAKITIHVKTTTDATVAANQDALKTWVNASIDIEGDATNRVNASHQFKVTVRTDSGDGTGPQLAGGVDVTVHKADAKGATWAPAGNQTCTTGSSGAGLGTCSITFPSAHPGTTTGTASASVTVAGKTFSISTTTDATIAAN